MERSEMETAGKVNPDCDGGEVDEMDEEEAEGERR